MIISNESIAILALISGITNYNNDEIRSYYDRLLYNMLVKILAIMSQLSNKIINCTVINLAIEENINNVGMFISDEYRQTGTAKIINYKNNANCIFIDKLEFLSSLETKIKEVLMDNFPGSQSSKIKISLNASYLMQRYIERKLISRLKNPSLCNTFLASKVNIIMVSFYNVIYDIIKIYNCSISLDNITELNFIINLSLSHVFNNVNNIDKSKLINIEEIYIAAIKMILPSFSTKNVLQKTNKIIELVKFHRNNLEPTQQILNILDSFVLTTIIKILRINNNIATIDFDDYFLNILGYFNVISPLNIPDMSVSSKYYVGYRDKKISNKVLLIIDYTEDFMDIDTTLYDNILPLENIIIEKKENWIFHKGTLYKNNKINVRVIEDNFKQFDPDIYIRNIPIVSDVNKELISKLNDLTVIT